MTVFDWPDLGTEPYPIMGDISPEDWRDRLLEALKDRADSVATLEDYYDGDHPLPEGVSPADSQAEYRRLLRQARTNWPRLIVTAPVERLDVLGFRPGPSADPIADLWRVWQENQMDADSSLAHNSALTVGSSYVVVWPDDKKRVSISIEHASQTIVAYNGASRRERVAALKTFTDDWGYSNVTVYLPDSVYKWISTHAITSGVDTHHQWVPRIVAGEEWPLPNKLGAVPVVELMANQCLRFDRYGWGRSEFGDVLPIIDRINRTTFHRLLAGDFAAVPQKAIIGWAPPEGVVIAPRVSTDRVWTFDNPNVSVTQFAAADLSNYTKAIEADVTHLGAITHTPPHYLLGQMVNISAQALAAAEAGLVAKVRRHQMAFGEAWEEVMRLAGRAANIPGADDAQLETIWRNPETRSDAERADAAVKLSTIGVPWEAIMEYLGYTNQQITRMRSQRATDALVAAALAPPPPQPAPAAPEAVDGSPAP